MPFTGAVLVTTKKTCSTPWDRRPRRDAEQAPDHHGAHLGLGLDPDDDPADGTNDALDGALESGDLADISGPQELPDADGLDARLRVPLDPHHGRPPALSENVLEASIAAIGFPIVFYYGLTGFACAIYYRNELGKCARNFLLLGIGPLLGGRDVGGWGKGSPLLHETENGWHPYSASPCRCGWESAA